MRQTCSRPSLCGMLTSVVSTASTASMATRVTMASMASMASMVEAGVDSTPGRSHTCLRCGCCCQVSELSAGSRTAQHLACNAAPAICRGHHAQYGRHGGRGGLNPCAQPHMPQVLLLLPST